MLQSEMERRLSVSSLNFNGQSLENLDDRFFSIKLNQGLFFTNGYQMAHSTLFRQIAQSNLE